MKSEELFLEFLLHDIMLAFSGPNEALHWETCDEGHGESPALSPSNFSKLFTYVSFFRFLPSIFHFRCSYLKSFCNFGF